MIKWSDYPLQKWSNPLLQGLAFWLGYRTQLYRFYPLSEGAIVNEAASLIHGNLEDKFNLECEVMYKRLGVSKAGQTRADIVIKKGKKIDTVIEVKRASSSATKIKNDLVRLAKVNNAKKLSRCYLLLVSQGQIPQDFVDANTGEASGIEIYGDGYTAKVRRLCKASASFKKKEKANYACLIEVISTK